MTTDDLIVLLAGDTSVVPRRGAATEIAIAMALGIPLAILTMLATMGTRPDLAQAMTWPMFWIKVLFPAAVACAGFWTLARLARPGADARAGQWAIAALIVLLWLMAIVAYAVAPVSERAAMVWGRSWRTCSVSVLLISVPILIAAFVVLRRFAPTRLANAGACAGVLSGGAGAAVYAFHCPATALPFMAIWYVAGIAATAGLGAVLGPRLLRW